MGRYLCIGLRTALTVERKKLKLPFMTTEEVQSDLERQLVPEHLYDKIESEDYVHYKLRDEAVRDEFIPFLKEFYTIRYDEIGEIDQNSDFYIKEISKYHDLKGWIELANEKYLEGFQISRNIDVRKIKNREYLSYHEEAIILSLTGYVWLECYNDLFSFMLNCIKLRLPQFKLKDTLSIYITN